MDILNGLRVVFHRALRVIEETLLPKFFLFSPAAVDGDH
jgi:hypothetical protein